MKRYRPLIWPLLLLLVVSLLTRVALIFRPDVKVDVPGLAGAIAVGSLYDLTAAIYALAPALLLTALLPDRVARWRVVRALAILSGALFCFVLLFTATSEWIFWDEFGGRFNFIAVDYLIYTHEVIGNIWQSYPVGKILLGLAALAALITASRAGAIWRDLAAPLTWRARVGGIAAAIVAPVLVFATVDSETKDVFASDALNELAGNGMYEFFAALRANDLDYVRLYRHLPAEDALAEARRLRDATRDGWRSADPRDFLHSVRDPAPARRLNVVLVSVESLGTEFIGGWGDTRGITPRLDALAAESLVFTRVYATGNRTVRGLEALSLGLPPTPGQSIVKRPRNDHLFSLGSVFEDLGYDTMFVYGGYGYFDNMNAFFAANDYRSIDRLAVPAERIHFENIWGIADEDLFDLALDEIDASLKASGGKRPVFAHVMTTSNHRPYTYPAGRVDIPSGSGREGAVKYTDWALGDFIARARERPWFDDTVFVILADHTSSARGKSDLPVEGFHIPLVVYSPRHVPAGRVDHLASQIDVAPTLLGLLGFTYRSRFFGQDILTEGAAHQRALLGNYQTVGYLEDGLLVELRPKGAWRVVDPATGGALPATEHARHLVDEAVGYYQSASRAFRSGALRAGAT